MMAQPVRTGDIADLRQWRAGGQIRSSAAAGLAGPQLRPARRAVHFLSLPGEIRTSIYDLLLVSRFNPKENLLWAVRNTC